MGWKWEVEQWQRNAAQDGYEWKTTYTGQSLLKAVLAMRRCKRDGHGCIQLVWRG
jgi:hypothetical protein